MFRLFLLVMFLGVASRAQDSQPASAPAALRLPPLQFKTGTVPLGDNLATLEVPAGLLFLGKADARTVVEKLWNNPPDPRIEGMLVPESGKDLRSWGVIITYEDSGHVDDQDAASLDYDAMLKSMQEGEAEDNKERRQRGFPTVQILGWAERPHYDAASRKLYWAKRLKFADTDSNTLNYDVRVLGRRGVLVLTAVAEDSELPVIAQNCKAILAGTQFVPGQRYEDFDSGIDKVAAYGIGGLIAGKLLLKAGLLKLLLKPLMVVGAVAAAGVVKLFGRKKNSATAS